MLKQVSSGFFAVTTTPLPSYVDADLLHYDMIWAAAGTLRAVFPVTPQDLVHAAHGLVADVKVEV